MTVALVTGASGGLGAAVARALAGAGFEVALGCHRNVAVAESLARELSRSGSRASVAAFDVASAEQTRDAVDAVVAQHGELGAVVNAAAENVDGLLGNVTPETAARIFAVNVGGTMNVIRAALPHLIARRGGRILNFSSVLAQRTTAGISAYAATKGAIESLTRALGAELGPRGITVNALAPGVIDAGLGSRLVATGSAWIRAWVPLRRPGTAAEVAAAAAFLLSGAASYVNGIILPVDGGLGAGSAARDRPAAPSMEEVMSPWPSP